MGYISLAIRTTATPTLAFNKSALRQKITTLVSAVLCTALVILQHAFCYRYFYLSINPRLFNIRYPFYKISRRHNRVIVTKATLSFSTIVVLELTQFLTETDYFIGYRKLPHNTLVEFFVSWFSELRSEPAYVP